MYGLQLTPKTGDAVLYRFASTTSRDAWIEGGMDRLAYDSEDEIDGMNVGTWTKGTNLPAGALMYAPVERSADTAPAG